MAKTTIHISGAIFGNSHLATKLSGDIERKQTRFNGYSLTFASKKEAVQSIREAFKSMCEEEPEMKNRLSGIRVNKDRTALYYDAIV